MQVAALQQTRQVRDMVAWPFLTVFLRGAVLLCEFVLKIRMRLEEMVILIPLMTSIPFVLCFLMEEVIP